MARAQEFELDTNALRQAFDAAETWAQANLNEDVLTGLQQVDRERVEQFLRDYQKQLEGQYVVDLAALKDAATVILPLLEAHEETLPYAVWLKSQLDYLDVAEELRRAAPPKWSGSTTQASAKSEPQWNEGLGAQSLVTAFAERRGSSCAKLKPILRVSACPRN
jgi:DNA-binding protein Fis